MKEGQSDYCFHFAAGHHSAFRAHLEFGQTLGKGDEVWRNVAEHCLVSGIYADVIAEKVGLDIKSRDRLVHAAILHDWGKKMEVLGMKDVASEDLLERLDLIKSNQDQVLVEVLRINSNVVDLTSANIPSGIEGLDSIEEKIIWFVDAMLSNTIPVSINQRFKDLERGWDGEKEDKYRAARNNSFSDIYRDRYNGKSLYELQRELGRKIGAELAELMEYEGSLDELPKFLEHELNNRLDSFSQ